MTDQSRLAGWGRRNGFVELGTPRDEPTVNQLADRLTILDVVNRYAWAFDERDLDTFYPFLSPDAVLEGSVAGAKRVGPFVGRAAIMSWLRGSMEKHSDQRRHVLSNPIFVSQSDDTATVNVFLSLTSTQDGQARLMMTGFYVFHFQKTLDGWVVSRVFAGFDNGVNAGPDASPAARGSS